MTLEHWVSNGWLRRHEPTEQEIADLLSVVERDLHDCLSPKLSDDWKLNIAYNAALRAATVALAASGYRVRKGQSQHVRTIQSLRFTLGAEAALVAKLDAFRSKRHTTSYDRVSATSAAEAHEMVELAEHLKQQVEEWLGTEHPELL